MQATFPILRLIPLVYPLIGHLAPNAIKKGQAEADPDFDDEEYWRPIWKRNERPEIESDNKSEPELDSDPDWAPRNHKKRACNSNRRGSKCTPFRKKRRVESGTAGPTTKAVASAVQRTEAGSSTQVPATSNDNPEEDICMALPRKPSYALKGGRLGMSKQMRKINCILHRLSR